MTGRPQPAVFLDRDGTVVTDPHYLADPDRLALIPGVGDAIRRLNAAGLTVVVVTNQSGIARGLYGEDDYRAVAARLDEVLESAGARVDATYYCPHHPDQHGHCDCRKPGTGLYVRAAAALGVDPAASYYVGDKLTDVIPAVSLAGQGILVRTGHGAAAEANLPSGFWVADDLPAAVELILRDQRSSSITER